mmetsp:Transcript_32580/g.46996  ORF Transcript_32580/g.46996 Transcript_32580/m.46996 type:complete len:90 (+) Transcript_32580:423-692(+)
MLVCYLYIVETPFKMFVFKSIGSFILSPMLLSMFDVVVLWMALFVAVSEVLLGWLIFIREGSRCSSQIAVPLLRCRSTVSVFRSYCLQA